MISQDDTVFSIGKPQDEEKVSEVLESILEFDVLFFFIFMIKVLDLDYRVRPGQSTLLFIGIAPNQ